LKDFRINSRRLLTDGQIEHALEQKTSNTNKMTLTLRTTYTSQATMDTISVQPNKNITLPKHATSQQIPYMILTF